MHLSSLQPDVLMVSRMCSLLICLIVLPISIRCQPDSQKVLQASPSPQNAGPLGPCDAQQLHSEFESAEHRLLGDAVTINIDGIVRSGANFKYPLGSNTLSFGQIVAMADFYSNSSFVNTCRTQLSDPGLTLQQRQVMFNGLIQSLETANQDPTSLDCITSVMDIQGIDTSAADDPAQCYAARNSGVPGGWDFEFTRCTSVYVSTALCNWDHFGQDAVTAFTAGHASALQAALQATDQLGLFRAYFLEAFAQHYLSDLFSAGHLRTPRRALHSTELVAVPNVFPGDECSKSMHDEDCANGIWVRNTLGESWPIFGDKQLLSSKSNTNRDQAFKAMQASADELLQVYKSKKPINPSKYAARSMIPILPGFQEPGNFNPMFAVSSDGKSLLQRADLNNRATPQVTSYSIEKLTSTQAGWIPIQSSVTNSGPVQNMYPRTVQHFTAESNMTQIRQLNATHLLLNRFGPVWTRLYMEFPNQTKLRSWNMLAQSIGPINFDMASVTWQFAKQFSTDVYVLIGAKGSNLVQLGMQLSKSGALTSTWSKAYPGAADCQSPEYTVGRFSSSDKEPAIIRSCVTADGTLHQVFAVANLSAPPVLANAWSSQPFSTSKPFVLRPTGQPAVYTEAYYSPSDKRTYWAFTTFSSSYTSRKTSTFVEQSTFRHQHYFVDTAASSAAVQRVVRVQYEETKFQLKVDVLKVSLDGPQVQLFLEQPMVFDVASCEALDWFLADINNDSLNDLVGYCPSGSAVRIITFLQASTGGFGPPLVTTITNDNFAQDFTGGYLKHIKTFQTDRFGWFSQRPLKKSNSIMQLFDNYGILGARLLAPVANNPQAYEVVGQYPAIAGQVSGPLGANGVGYMLDDFDF